MTFRTVHIGETDSTNNYVATHGGEADMAVWADFQTAGRGCGSNTWESAPGQNLLLSMLVHPAGLEARDQFRISMAAALALTRALSTYTDGLSIKWPNDIYWHDSKLAGILIELKLSGTVIRQSVVGVGLNVNQTRFEGPAPNPVSLCQIVGRRLDREQVLQRVLDAFTLDVDPADYRRQLYRREGYHPYRDAGGRFEARLLTVADDGTLHLEDRAGRRRSYAFKEVAFELPRRG